MKFLRHRAPAARGVLTTVLGIVEPALDAVPIPGVKAVVGTLLEVLKGIDRTDQNEETLRGLLENITQLRLAVVEPLARMQPTGISPELNNAVELLTAKISECSSTWTVRSKRSRIVRFFQREAEYQDLRDLSTSIRQAVDVFSLGALVQQAVVGTQIKGELKTIHDAAYSERISRLLEDLNPVKYAGHHSGRPNAPTVCLKGTRTTVLAEIQGWISNDATSTPPLLWLNGAAGTGKSTITQTISQSAESRGYFVASFFCSRQDLSLRDPTRIIPTIAYQLAQSGGHLRGAISESLENHRSISAESLQRQLGKLLLEPLRKLQSSHAPIFVAIDAIDEAEGDAIRPLLQLLKKAVAAPDFPTRTRILITSRPEQHIRSVFNAPGNHRIVVLHDIERTAVKADVAMFLRAGLDEIAVSLEQKLLRTWVKQKDMQILVAQAGDLFIAAATLLRFIGDPKVCDPERQIRILLGTRQAIGARMFAQLDALYYQVLENSVVDTTNRPVIIDRFQKVVGSIIFVKRPLGISALETLAGVEPGEARAALSQLHSVFIVPDSNDEPPYIYHPSFRDFLTSPERCKKSLSPSQERVFISLQLSQKSEFLVEEPLHEGRLALRCLDLMMSQLKRDMVGLESQRDIMSTEISRNMSNFLSPELEYACYHWASHLLRAVDVDQRLAQALEDFTSRCLLWWMEALSLLGEVSSGIDNARKAQASALSLPCSNDVALLLADSYHFMATYHTALQAHPPGVYAALLLFSKESTLYKTYSHVQLDPRTSYIPGIPKGHRTGIYSIAFSSDGKKLVTGCVDGNVRLWDAATGTEIYLMPGHKDWIVCVSFSPQSERIVSASHDWSARIWDSKSGEELRLLQHRGWVNSAKFTRDGRWVASGAEDHTIRLWDATSGELLRTCLCHTGPVHCMAFSPDGSYLAVGHLYGSISIWTSDLREVSELTGHSGAVSDLSFSPDGKLLASSAWDKTARVWNPSTKDQIATFEGHSDWVNSVTFTQEGTHVISGADDNTVRMWDSATGTEVALVGSHQHWVLCVNLSPVGPYIASGSWDGSISVWHAVTNKRLLNLNVSDRA